MSHGDVICYIAADGTHMKAKIISVCPTHFLAVVLPVFATLFYHSIYFISFYMCGCLSITHCVFYAVTVSRAQPILLMAHLRRSCFICLKLLSLQKKTHLKIFSCFMIDDLLTFLLLIKMDFWHWFFILEHAEQLCFTSNVDCDNMPCRIFV